jgi:hypothetical protein
VAEGNMTASKFRFKFYFCIMAGTLLQFYQPKKQNYEQGNAIRKTGGLHRGM